MQQIEGPASAGPLVYSTYTTQMEKEMSAKDKVLEHRLVVPGAIPLAAIGIVFPLAVPDMGGYNRSYRYTEIGLGLLARRIYDRCYPLLSGPMSPLDAPTSGGSLDLHITHSADVSSPKITLTWKEGAVTRARVLRAYGLVSEIVWSVMGSFELMNTRRNADLQPVLRVYRSHALSQMRKQCYSFGVEPNF